VPLGWLLKLFGSLCVRSLAKYEHQKKKKKKKKRVTKKHKPKKKKKMVPWTVVFFPADS
jgi:hypothetical protein